MNKRTLVIGASPKPGKRSYNMVKKLVQKGFEVIAIGRMEGEINEIPIQTGRPALTDIHTVILYLRPEYQPPYVDYILSLNPSRLIFNSKTENEELRQAARQQGIETLNACSLVMIGMDEY
jgi:predicted CoA-binding protein